MKTTFKITGQLLAGTVLMIITWMFGLGIGDAIIPSNFAEVDASPGRALAAILLVCFLNTTILTIMIKRSTWYGWKLVWAVALVLYGIQFFMSMIEGLVFNDVLNMPEEGFYSILVGGFVFIVLFSPILVLINGKIKKSEDTDFEQVEVNNFYLKVGILAVLVYPALYFLAGYFIAWQSEVLREFYSGSTELNSFSIIMQDNFRTGMVYFQFVRGLLWLAIAWPVYQMLKGSKLEKGVIIGLLFALIMNTQHLIPNPYMPAEVSTYHFIETALSNFIWGFLIVIVLAYNPAKKESNGDKMAIPAN